MPNELFSKKRVEVSFSKFNYGDDAGCVVSIDSNSETVELIAVKGVDGAAQVRALEEGAEYLRRLADRIDALANYQGSRFNDAVQTALNTGKELPQTQAEA